MKLTYATMPSKKYPKIIPCKRWKRNCMNFIQRYIVRKREEARLWQSVCEMRAQNEAIQRVFHEMCASIGIDRLKEIITDAEKNEKRYMSLAEMYINELRIRRNQK